MEYPGVQPHVHALAGVISSLFLFLFSLLLLSYAVAILFSRIHRECTPVGVICIEPNIARFPVSLGELLGIFV